MDRGWDHGVFRMGDAGDPSGRDAPPHAGRGDLRGGEGSGGVGRFYLEPVEEGGEGIDDAVRRGLASETRPVSGEESEQ
jgi:hypothetical protein